MHIDLTQAIPFLIRERLDEEYALLLKVRPNEIPGMWPRCWLLIGFKTKDDFIIQACKQYLSHHHCIISTLLFGLSLSPYYINNGPVVSADASALYLNSGLSAVLKNEDQKSLQWLLESHYGLFQNICRQFLKLSQSDFTFDNRLVDYAAAYVAPREESA